MLRTNNFLGSFYWDERLGLDELEANQFNFDLPEGVEVLETEQLCPCGNYGRKVTFRYQDKIYSFNYLTGYPCQC